MAKIHQAIIQVMREVGAIERDQTNKDRGYKYRSTEAVYNRVQPLFSRHGIFGVPRVLQEHFSARPTKSGGQMNVCVLKMQYEFFAEDGSSVVVEVLGEGSDVADGAVAKAITIAHRYAICQLLQIPYAVSDPESSTPDWAAAYIRKVSPKDLTDLKRRWMETVADSIQAADRETAAAAFVAWVKEVVDVEFDPLDPRQWTTESWVSCNEALCNHSILEKGATAC